MGGRIADRDRGLAGQAVSEVKDATKLGRKGHKVFPVIENGKIPAIGAWPQRATSDERQIEALWTEQDPVLNVTRHKPYNIGISTTGLLVLDVDNKGQKRGSDTLAELDVIYGLPQTYTVETPTGGYHLYFKPKAAVRNSACKIGPGLDVRGDGGYVLGPGSTIDGRAYQALNDLPIAEAPEWLEDMAGKPVEKQQPGQVIEFLDTKPALDRAKAYLDNAPPAIEGQGGDALTFRVAAKVKDFGVSELACLELMHEHWNERCSPMWNWEELAVKVANAYAYGKKPVGTESAQADFDAVEIPMEKRPKLYVKEFGEIKPRLKDDYLIQKLLGEAAMSVVYGESNVGKTFFAMAVAFAVAAGTPFAKRKTRQGAVLYVAAEAGVSAENRVAALAKHYGATSVPFGLVPCPVDLLRPNGDTQALIDLIRQYEAKHGKVKLVVIDTLSRAIAGGNENSPDDMGALVKHLDAIRVSTGAHVMVVHHSGKDTAKGARGHSLLRAATDTEIELTPGLARMTKQRDMEMGEAVGFDLVGVDLGTNGEGDAVTSCVAVPLDAAVVDFGEDPSEERLMLEALDAAVTSNGGRPVDVRAWTAACNDYIEMAEIKGPDGIISGPFSGVTLVNRRKLMERQRDKLRDKGMVLKNKKDQWIRAKRDKT